MAVAAGALGSVGEFSVATKIGERGSDPLFVASNDISDGPAFAQLVAPGSDVPVRWSLDERFQIDSEFGTVWLGSNIASPLQFLDIDDPVEAVAWRTLQEDFANDVPDDCANWQRTDGVNFVKLAIWQDTFDGYIGYNSDDEIVAITWHFEVMSWSQAALPGLPPPILRELRE